MDVFRSADLEHDFPWRAPLLDQPQRVGAVLERQAGAHGRMAPSPNRRVTIS